MIKMTGVYHTGIPVDDIDRAERFYISVLGLELDRRVGEPGSQLSRLKCGNDTVVLFERPRALHRDSLKEDGVYHQAFELDVDLFDQAVASIQKAGTSHQIIERPSGKTIYFWDTEGNYEEIHASRSEEHL